MSAYTPATRQIEDFWASGGIEQPAAKSHDRAEGVAEFRRWLEQHDREVARQERVIPAEALTRDPGLARWLRNRNRRLARTR